MKLLPYNKYQYPFYMAVYWLLLWAIVSLILYANVMQTATNGMVIKRDCLKKYDKVCTLYSRKYEVPVDQEAGTQIIVAGIVIGFFVNVGGFSQMLLRKKG